MSASYVAGYRVGMVVSGAGSLYLADWFGSSSEAYDYTAWRDTYRLMGAVMLIGIATTLAIREPERNAAEAPATGIGAVRGAPAGPAGPGAGGNGRSNLHSPGGGFL